MGIDPPAPFHPTATRKVRSVVDVKIAPVVVVVVGGGTDNTSSTSTTNTTNTIEMDIDSNNNVNNVLSEPMICITNQEQYYDNEEETATTGTGTMNTIINIPIKKQLELFETWDECAKRIVHDDMKISIYELQSQSSDSVVSTEFLYASNHIDHENNRHCIIIYILLTITIPKHYTTTSTTGTTNTCYQSIMDDINSRNTTNHRKVRMYEYMTITELQTKANTISDSIHPDLLHLVQDILPTKIPVPSLTTTM